MPGQLSGKGTDAFPRSDRNWPRVIATEIMQLSRGQSVCKFGIFKENVKKQLIIFTTKIIYIFELHDQTRDQARNKASWRGEFVCD